MTKRSVGQLFPMLFLVACGSSGGSQTSGSGGVGGATVGGSGGAFAGTGGAQSAGGAIGGGGANAGGAGGHLSTSGGAGGNGGTADQGTAGLGGGIVAGPGGAAGGAAGSAVGGSAGGAGGMGGSAASTNDKLDLLFMIDDSYSMAPLQLKFADAFPSVLDPFLKNPTTGHPTDLHVAVVSSSLGGGAWSNVNQCTSGHPGDDAGTFQQGMGGARNGSCTGLDSGETYLITGDGDTVAPNFSGDIGGVFSCMALLGDQGCGFESQFESVQVALTKAQLPKGLAPAGDPDNGGFLRADARLAIVMLTNEDDCSVPPQSLLLYTGINSKLDPSGLGALQSYRCNEFGHLCADPNGGTAKVPPPHDIDMASPGITLNACESAEDDGKIELISPLGTPDPTMGHLVTVASFVTFLKGLKPDPRDLFVAAIAGPPTPYVVVPIANGAANGEIDPMVQHSCSVMANGTTTVYGDPSVRINQWVQNFGANGFFQSICADDFSPTLTSLAAAVHAP